MAYDDVKVQAVVNQINGKSADGTGGAPVPNLFGMIPARSTRSGRRVRSPFRGWDSESASRGPRR